MAVRPPGSAAEARPPDIRIVRDMADMMRIDAPDATPGSRAAGRCVRHGGGAGWKGDGHRVGSSCLRHVIATD
jgi:hypothetical protein